MRKRAPRAPRQSDRHGRGGIPRPGKGRRWLRTPSSRARRPAAARGGRKRARRPPRRNHALANRSRHRRLRLWRISARRFEQLDGRGAELYGGRWNSPGRPLVYAASTLSLAMLDSSLACPGERFHATMWRSLEVSDDVGAALSSWMSSTLCTESRGTQRRGRGHADLAAALGRGAGGIG